MQMRAATHIAATVKQALRAWVRPALLGKNSRTRSCRPVMPQDDASLEMARQLIQLVAASSCDA
jgi:hypothetical protein